MVTISNVKLPNEKVGVKVPVKFTGKNHHTCSVRLNFKPTCGCTTDVPLMEVEAGAAFVFETVYSGSLTPWEYSKQIEVVAEDLCGDLNPMTFFVTFSGKIV